MCLEGKILEHSYENLTAARGGLVSLLELWKGMCACEWQLELWRCPGQSLAAALDGRNEE